MTNRFAILATLVAAFLLPAVAQAADGEAASNPAKIALGLALGLAALGGTLGQGRAAATALEGITRNPNSADKAFTPMLLGLAFIESLVIFVWVANIM